MGVHAATSIVPNVTICRSLTGRSQVRDRTRGGGSAPSLFVGGKKLERPRGLLFAPIIGAVVIKFARSAYRPRTERTRGKAFPRPYPVLFLPYDEAKIFLSGDDKVVVLS
ncbi:MAG TPA: hypothetical protein VLH13_05495 [Methanomassiliicoccales archaeon]|nr:hypothetical protein [Methanomassiliicoccales archaeon]